ncbi:MAG TPA: dienelactone hydrolase family protein [Candidatus Acidoferrales bacterium]|nr:dienelactone hydrolase family protein [Candidatus Acidoferrales bacterium]
MATEKDIEIKMADGICDAVLYENEDGRKRPGAIHLPDIMGIRASHRAMAKRLAEAGYTVLLPNPFYRTARGVLFDFTPNFAGDPRTMQRFGELAGPLTPEAMERDMASYVNYLAVQKSVSDAKMGVVGHCFTGAMALRGAAARPDRISAVASFHGGGLYTDKPNSPHLVLSRIAKSNGAQLYFGHAVNDHSMPQEAIDKLNGALKAWGGKYESEVYADALHGWTVADSAAYKKPQAERAFGKLTALFAAALK